MLKCVFCPMLTPGVKFNIDFVLFISDPIFTVATVFSINEVSIILVKDQICVDAVM